MFGLFGGNAEILINLDNPNGMKTLLDSKGSKTSDDNIVSLFKNGDDVKGTVTIKSAKNFDHLGIKVQLIGQIELLYDRNNPYEFLSYVKDLSPPGTFSDTIKTYDYEFSNIDFSNDKKQQLETYRSDNIKLRFLLKLKLNDNIYQILKELDFAVQALTIAPSKNKSIKMEVGIEDCLHIEFEYNHSKFHLSDVVVGKIYFLLVRIKIKHMEVIIVKRESTGSGSDIYNENENITKFQIMDGAPVRGESIPVRIFLQPYNLSPTMKAVHNVFSVRYFKFSIN